MESTVKRRWFSYSLRTMFVVLTVFCVWLGYQVNWIRQRTNFIAEQTAHYVQRGGDPSHWTNSARGTATAPGLLWLLGETGFEALQFDVAVEDFKPGRPFDSYPEIKREKLRVKRLFPEVKLLDVEPFPLEAFRKMQRQ